MMELLEKPREMTVPAVNRRDVRLHDGMSEAIRENFHARGAVGVYVSVFSYPDQPQVKRVILDSDVFQHVILSLEQVNLILVHLFNPTSTQTVFVMAQAIESGTDLDLVYDTATGIRKTPYAARKASAA